MRPSPRSLPSCRRSTRRRRRPSARSRSRGAASRPPTTGATSWRARSSTIAPCRSSGANASSGCGARKKPRPSWRSSTSLARCWRRKRPSSCVPATPSPKRSARPRRPSGPSKRCARGRPRCAIAAPPDPQLTAALASDLHIPEPLAALLVQRGLAAPELAKAFLRPDLERLSDPHAWADMPRAVELVVAALRAGAPILVHGDYDVDGQCAAALLTRVLSSVGRRVHAFVPHALRDVYDFGPAGLAEARRPGAGLILTCDCGITAVHPVRAARAAGIDVIVTDHHLPGDELPPASAVLDPRRADR